MTASCATSSGHTQACGIDFSETDGQFARELGQSSNYPGRPPGIEALAAPEYDFAFALEVLEQRRTTREYFLSLAPAPTYS